jgi:hypothetical protein
MLVDSNMRLLTMHRVPQAARMSIISVLLNEVMLSKTYYY